MNEVKYGDIIYTKQGYYRHYGIYINENCVIHYDGKLDDFWLRDMQIRETEMDRFLGNKKHFYICKSNTKYDAQQIVDRARSKIGDQNFDLVYNNCEHFSRWCQCGSHKSVQVNLVCMLVITMLGINNS